MSLKQQIAAASLLTLAAALPGCAKHTEAAATPPPVVLSEEYKRKLAAVGAKLVKQDRADEAAKRAKMAKVIDATVLQTRDSEDGFDFLLQLHNKTAKTITKIGAGLEVHDSSGTRVGIMEIDESPAQVGPKETARIWEHERFVRFGSDAGNMRQARGKAKRALIKIMEVKYADGSDWGYDD